MTTGPNRHGYDWKPHPHPRGELPLDISIALVTTSNEQSDDLSGGTPAPSWSTAASRSPPGSPSSGSCATTSPSSARPSCAASPTRRPSSGGTACLPRYPATRTGLCCAKPSGLTRSTSTTPASPRATGRPGSAASPARSCASASPSTSTRTLSRSSAATGSPARRA